MAAGNVFWQDTVENISILTEVANYNKESGYLKATGGRPLLAIADKDTLFMASDTLLSTEASETDTTRLMEAYEDVRIFKEDLQAIADSLAFISKDSLFKLFKAPILWSDTSQFKGDSIYIQMKGGGIDKIYLYGNAFIVTTPDLQFFNQIKGKNITAFFKNNELDKVKVVGNAEAVYYALDEVEAYLGATKTICSEMLILFDNQNVSRIKFFTQPSSEVLPMKQVIAGPPKLDGFTWDFEIRPKSIADLRDKTLVMKRSVGGSGNTTTPAAPAIDAEDMSSKYNSRGSAPAPKPSRGRNK